MITNSDITVYHKGLDKTTKLETWTRFNYNGGWSFKSNGSTRDKGLTNNNVLDVRIPYTVPDLNAGNFAIGDIIIPQKVTKDIETSRDLVDYTLYHIKTINNNLFGGRPHIHIKGD